MEGGGGAAGCCFSFLDGSPDLPRQGRRVVEKPRLASAGKGARATRLSSLSRIKFLSLLFASGSLDFFFFLAVSVNPQYQSIVVLWTLFNRSRGRKRAELTRTEGDRTIPSLVRSSLPSCRFVLTSPPPPHPLSHPPKCVEH